MILCVLSRSCRVLLWCLLRGHGNRRRNERGSLVENGGFRRSGQLDTVLVEEVALETCAIGEALVAHITLKGLLLELCARVLLHVIAEVSTGNKVFEAFFALEGLLTGVQSLMANEIAFLCKSFAAGLAAISFGTRSRSRICGS